MDFFKNVNQLEVFNQVIGEVEHEKATNYLKLVAFMWYLQYYNQ